MIPYETYRAVLGGQAAIGNVSMAAWANLPQRARDGWQAAVRAVVPTRRHKPSTLAGPMESEG